MPTAHDDSWRALFRPGEANAYFQDDVTAFDPSDDGNLLVRAWWCAELSRLIYRQGRDEVGDDALDPPRDVILASFGLHEAVFISEQGTQALLVTSRDGDTKPFTILVFRGTHDLRDWLTNLTLTWTDWPSGGVVHSGFKQAFDAVWPSVATALGALPDPLFMTGHSLGGALATLAASVHRPAGLVTFGCPRVGDEAFVDSIDRVKHARFVNNRDIVTTLPMPQGPPGYRHHGELHQLTRDSRLLIDPSDAELSDDRDANDTVWPSNPLEWAKLFDLKPARFLSDHAPVNYVAHLAACLHEPRA